MSRRERRGAGGLVGIAGVVLAALVVFGVIGPGLVSFPFTQETKDHSPPVVLNEIRDLAEFRAAEAEFEVIVDREKDVRWVPGFIAGERVQYVAVGTVDAVVDFSGLTEDDVIVDPDDGSVTVVLPAPTYGDPELDYERSGVMNRDRGLLDRVGGVFNDNPTAEEGLIVEAEAKMTEAVAHSDLLEHAEENTEEMLSTLLGGAGVAEVDVVFDGSART